ncbi:hypothetical protein D6C92_08513 [Aureobasidium pullulans]|nr:hypothetical protein D6C92_08513 [Aureobasidium pullulans]
MKLSTVFGASAVVAGTLTGATTTNSAVSTASVDKHVDVDIADDGVRGRVYVLPADNSNCNSPIPRKEESFKHNKCQHWQRDFRSLSAFYDFTRQEYEHECILVAFTDKHCRDNGAKIISLDKTYGQHTCAPVDLELGGNSNSETMAGNSVKWVCDWRAQDYIKKAAKSTQAAVTTESVDPTSVTTVTVDCTLTTDVGFSATASSRVITETSVSTHLATHTRVVTHIQSHTIPFSSTYSVCDVEVSTLY